MATYHLICDYCLKAHTSGRRDKKFCSDAHRMHASRLRRGELEPGRARLSSEDITAAERLKLDEDYLRRVHEGVQLGLIDPTHRPVKR